MQGFAERTPDGKGTLLTIAVDNGREVERYYYTDSEPTCRDILPLVAEKYAEQDKARAEGTLPPGSDETWHVLASRSECVPIHEVFSGSRHPEEVYQVVAGKVASFALRPMGERGFVLEEQSGRTLPAYFMYGKRLCDKVRMSVYGAAY
ncbi:hypothetical protein [Geminicoccus harenae]|uniref:hypothetical protein n=1 Tax=Geminicoccus harenae TaxID=2498453 RepID=UPI001C953E0D|nr:hypothetical protein [Geminicoccus harenae]